MENKFKETVFERYSPWAVIFCWVLLLATLFFMTSCGGSKKVHIEKYEKIASVEKKDSIHTSKDTRVNTIVYRAINEDFFLPLDVEGKIPNFTRTITTGNTTAEITKTDHGFLFKLLQNELITTDTVATTDNYREKTTDSDTQILDHSEKEKTITRWSRFQWFLLLFFLAVAGYIVYRLIKKFKPSIL